MTTSSGVDEYIAALPPDARELMELLRATIREAAPEAAETISYRIPAFRDRGRMLVFFAAFRDHCSMYPATGVVIDALGAELKPYLSGKATIRFRLDQPVPVELVAKVVQLRLEENAARRRR